MPRNFPFHERRRARPSVSDKQVPGLPARRAALRLLDAVTRRGEPLETALHAATQGLTLQSDKALAHAIAADTLRWMIDLDTLIDSATEQVLPEDAKARMVLRLALVQILILETPPHAAISTALPLVDGGPRKLVHGVLGTLIRGEAQLPEVPTLADDLATRWRDQWGDEMVAAAARALARRASIDLTLADVAETASFTEQMDGTSLLPGHVRVPHDRAVPELPGFTEGRWWVQDIAASIPARLAGPGEGRTAIDLCAAPGGKTMQLAAAGWSVTALDKSAKRLERLAQNLKRSSLSAQVAQGDALTWEPPTPADLILLDAPCSATGIFRRHPDVLHRAGPRQIAETAELQERMLARAASWVKPGGMLIYAVCSLERAEGEDQIVRFVESHPTFAIESEIESAIQTRLKPDSTGYIRTLPGMLEEEGGLDGFFICRLKRHS
ncbi:MAG: RsmB/NOP family class I SAM-dependent RNA methyltransferase [Sphingobium sp.]